MLGMKNKVKEVLFKQTTLTILNVVLLNRETKLELLIRELRKENCLSRAQAYRNIQQWENLGLLVQKKGKGRKMKIIKIKFGKKKLLRELQEVLVKTENLLQELEQKEEETSFGRRKDQIYAPVKKIENVQWSNERSMVTGISEEQENRNCELLPEKRLDRSNGKKKTKTTVNTVNNRWKNLRKGKIETNYTKKQKKILSGLL
jgi:hypothetical protein